MGRGGEARRPEAALVGPKSVRAVPSAHRRPRSISASWTILLGPQAARRVRRTGYSCPANIIFRRCRACMAESMFEMASTKSWRGAYREHCSRSCDRTLPAVGGGSRHAHGLWCCEKRQSTFSRSISVLQACCSPFFAPIFINGSVTSSLIEFFVYQNATRNLYLLTSNSGEVVSSERRIRFDSSRARRKCCPERCINEYNEYGVLAHF
jgi:hypothetical protein